MQHGTSYSSTHSFKTLHFLFESRPNKEADFLIIDMGATELLARRMTQTKTLDEQLFVLMMHGDDRVIEETIIAGISRYKKGAA